MQRRIATTVPDTLVMGKKDKSTQPQQGKGSAMSLDGLEAALDESLYSRQLYVLGKDAMRRMANSDVLLSGVGGLGVEIAKNIILGGIKSLTLHDPKPVEWQDLSSQYYLTESDIGSNRAAVSLGHLSSLNPYVNVQHLTTTSPLTTEILSNYNVLVLTEVEGTSPEILLELTEFCHQNGIALVLAQTNGLFGRIFCDMGEDFVILDSNGKEPLTRFVTNVTKGKEAVVTCTERHGFFSGDHVVFREVAGMVELNTLESMQITVTDPFKFSVGVDTSEFGAYLRDGTVTQVKVPQKVSYKSYRDSVKAPKIINYNYAKLDHPLTLHVAYEALNKFILEQGRVPRSWDEEDAQTFVTLAEESAAAGTGSGTGLKTELLRQFSFIARGQLAPVNGIIGGIAAQEVMKACSGKFSPINQWLYFDAVECLPDDSPSDKSDFEAWQSRYDGQTAVFGNYFQSKLEQQDWFVVGAGAIGCELLKNFAMMGIGYLTVTDMDFIEKSNLNRQFLFRPENVGQSKALTAKAAIQKINPLISIEAHENRVGACSEGVYGEKFYRRLNGVANALDNVEARLYMDRQCIRHRLPLLESGTMGTKGNVQVVLPFITESYGSVKEGPKDEIPLCTLKSFPNAIEHTLQWARDLFQGLFTQPMENALSFLKDPTFLEKLLDLPGDQSSDALKSLYQVLQQDRPSTFEDCVTWARWQWEDHFQNQILQLLFNFPSDAKTSSGLHFWEAPKRCPQPLEFTLLENDGELALDFVFTAANLRADCYGIQREDSKRRVKEILENVHVPPFTPQAGVTISTTEDEAQAVSASPPAVADLDLKQQMADKIRALDCTDLKILPLEFEKDDDANLHMDFVVATSNSRASNYGIAHADRLKSKLIAGKIIPAIATTTSVVAGFVGLELIKILQGLTSIEKYSNVFINLAIPKLTITQPAPPPLKFYNGVKWTLWDTIDVEGELTVGEFIEWFKREHKLQVDMISQDQGTSVLYAWFWSQEQIDAMLPLRMTEAVQNVTGKEVGRNVSVLIFEVCCNELDGEELPPVRYLIKGKNISYNEFTIPDDVITKVLNELKGILF